MGVLGYEPLESQMGDGCHSDGAETGGARRREFGVVAVVEPGGLGERAGLRPGDRILSINGEPIRDAIDLLFHGSEYELEIEFERPDPANPDAPAAPATASVERDSGEELGIGLEDFKIRMCNNQCVFCFIHQNPAGMRKGIYFKDGDFRMSFLHGNYITTTNMKDEDFERIIEQRLSPMYVSVHTTNHDLRVRMLGVKRAPDVMDRLRLLRDGEIEFHTQIVLCPGWNDGPELERTLKDLSTLHPRLLSIAIVPLGLTEHREGLPKMDPVTPSFCKRTIELVEPWQARFMKKYKEPLVYLADEFYVTADLPAPDYTGLDVLHQLENGVGMVWDFMSTWRQWVKRLPTKLERPRSVAVMTGLLGARVLRDPIERMRKIEGLRVEIIPCLNSLFGRSITVSGLLSGTDFLRGVAENPGFDQYLIPGNAVRAEGERFLDDMTLEDLNQRCGGRVAAIDGGVADLMTAILDGQWDPAHKPKAKRI